MIVQTTLHANLENASILVLLQMSVLQMQIVESQGIRQYAHVLMGILVPLKYHAHYVSRFHFCYNLHSFKNILIQEICNSYDNMGKIVMIRKILPHYVFTCTKRNYV